MSPVPRTARLPQAEQHRLIPYDYQFQFDLQGRGGSQRKTLSVSIEAPFSAVSIGYGVIPAISTATFGPSLADLQAPIDSAVNPRLADIPLSAVLAAADRALARLSREEPAATAALRAGIQINPAVAELALQNDRLDPRSLQRLFRVAGSASSEIQFLYALFDEGTGRAFQSEPILNVAGLGTSSGERPFRQFSPPIVFAPRTNIGLEITEVTSFVGRLYVVLQGYKVLGSPGQGTR